MNPLFTLGEEFRFHDSSRFRKKAGDAKLRFYHGFVPVLMSLAAESCRSRAESVHLLKPYLQWEKGGKSSNFVTPDDSARNRKMRKMMSRNCSICLMPIFGVGKAYRIWTPKGGPPQFSTWMFCVILPVFCGFMVSGELLKQLGAFRASCRNPKNRIATRSKAWIWRARFWSRLLLK